MTDNTTDNLTDNKNEQIEEQPKRALWFPINTISNYEKKVENDLQKFKKSRSLDAIHEIYLPLEKYITGTCKTKERPRCPGYLYAKIEVDGNDQPPMDIWYIIRNTQGCLGILNHDGYMLSVDEEKIEALKKKELDEVVPKAETETQE